MQGRRARASTLARLARKLLKAWSVKRRGPNRRSSCWQAREVPEPSVAREQERLSRVSGSQPKGENRVPTEKDSNGFPREMKALGILALVAVAFVVRIALPVGVGLFLGALLAFTLQPLYGRLRARRLGAKPAALVCTLGATTFVSAIVAAFMALFITRGIAMVGALPSLLGSGGAWRQAGERHLRTTLGFLHLEPSTLATKLEGEAVGLGSRVAGWTAEIAGASFGALLTLLFMSLATYFVLVHWNDVVSHAETMLPFAPRHTHALLLEFRRVGRQVLRGTVVTGLMQGVLAAVGYAFAGVRDPLFFGALTAAASLVPAVGTLLVWVPMGIYLASTGHVAAGIFELVFSAVVVGIIPDYFIRPKLVGSEQGVPAVFTFVALFGGVEVFGFIGLILGPVIVTLAIAVLRTYDKEVREARAT